jgi:hypothetical protein
VIDGVLPLREEEEENELFEVGFLFNSYDE